MNKKNFNVCNKRSVDFISFARLAAILTAEIRRCAQQGVDWRQILLARSVVMIPGEQQPAPDGSSLEYIEMAYNLGVEQRIRDTNLTELSPMLALADEIIQSEIKLCIVNERRLIVQVGKE